MLRAFQKWVYDLSSTTGGHLSRQMGTIDMEHTIWMKECIGKEFGLLFVAISAH